MSGYPHAEDLSSVLVATEKAIQDGMTAVIGGELSEESFVMRDKLGPNKIVFLTPTSSNPSVTEGHPYSFRSCFSDRLVADRLAVFTLENLKPQAIGVIRNVSSPYTDFLSKQFVESAQKRIEQKRQAIPILEEKILRDTKDFSAQIKKFIDAKVSHVAMLAHQNDLLRFTLQAANMNFFPVYIGSDGWGSNEHIYKKLVQEAPSGNKFVSYRNSYWKEESPTKTGKEFTTKYRKLFNKEPTAWSAISFDGALALFSAMRSAKAQDGDSIRSELLKLKNLPLVTTNRFSFGDDNSPVKDLFIYKIDKNGVKYEATLK